MIQYNNQLDRAKSEAHKIILACQYMTLDYPNELLNYAPGGQVAVYARLKTSITSLLYLNDITQANALEKTEQVTNDLLKIYRYVAEGISLADTAAPVIISLTPEPYFLNKYEFETFGNNPPHDFWILYFLQALASLADFEYYFLRSFATPQTFDKPEKAKTYIEYSIDGQGSLMIAQEAYQLGQTSLERSMGNLRFSQQQAIIDENQGAANPEKRKINLAETNQKTSEAAKIKYAPLIQKVHEKILSGHTINRAAKIIASKYSVNSGTLRNHYNDWKKVQTELS